MHTQRGDRGGRARTWILSTLVAAASAPLAQAPAFAASHGFPPAGTFACDSSIWQELQMDENHDSLVARLDTQTASPGQTVSFTLVWEWRDWRPGATLTFRHCLDVDSGAAVDGRATAPFDALGGNPPDVTVVHPTDQPTSTVMKGPEVRPAVTMPFTLTVPATAPVGSEVCSRSAILADPVEHRFSPPDYDISETVCLTVTAPPSPTPPPPAPTPTPSPSPVPGTVPGPPAEALPTHAAPQPPAEALGMKVLPRTGASLPMLALIGALLLLGGAAIARRTPKPFPAGEAPETGPRDG